MPTRLRHFPRPVDADMPQLVHGSARRLRRLLVAFDALVQVLLMADLFFQTGNLLAQHAAFVALKVVSKGVNAMRGEGFGAMIITHYQRLLNYITPDVVHVMMDGKVVLSGGPELAVRLEKEGYAKLAEELGFTYTEEA